MDQVNSDRPLPYLRLVRLAPGRRLLSELSHRRRGATLFDALRETHELPEIRRVPQHKKRAVLARRHIDPLSGRKNSIQPHLDFRTVPGQARSAEPRMGVEKPTRLLPGLLRRLRAVLRL